MDRIIFFSLVYTVVLLAVSCSQPEELGENEYIAWFNSEKNPAVRKVDGEKFNYVVKYTPTDYILSAEGLNGVETDRVKRENQLKDLLFFHFKIQMEKESSIQANEKVNDKKFEELKEYVRMQAQKDFKLKINSENVHPAIYHMERSVIYNTITVVMGFEVKQEFDEFTLVFKNRLSEDELSFEFDVEEFPLLIRN